MSKNEIIERWANERLVENLIEGITKKPLDENTKDLANDIYLSLLLKDDKLIEGLEKTNTYKFFIVRALTNQLFSVRSPYYTDYIEPRRQCTEIYE